jgi:hypothetical protein
VTAASVTVLTDLTVTGLTDLTVTGLTDLAGPNSLADRMGRGSRAAMLPGVSDRSANMATSSARKPARPTGRARRIRHGLLPTR